MNSAGRPKTRNQWDEYYEKFNEEKKRKRNRLSESGSSSERVRANADQRSRRENSVAAADDDEVMVVERSRESSAAAADHDVMVVERSRENSAAAANHEVVVVEREKKKARRSDEVNGEAQKTTSSEGNKEMQVKDIDFFADFQTEKGKGKGKGKEKEKSSGDVGSESRKDESRCLALVDCGEESDDEVQFIGETKIRFGHKGRGRLKEKVESVDDDLMLVGAYNQSIDEFGLKTHSGSGSKVGSVDGRSPGVITYDEVASSTSKRGIKDKDSVSEESLDLDASAEFRDYILSESSSSSEDDDDSEDGDYKVNDSSSSSEMVVVSSSDDTDGEEKAPEIKPRSSLVKNAAKEGGSRKVPGKRKGIVSHRRSSSKSLKQRDSDFALDEDSEEDDNVQKRKRMAKNRRQAARNLNVKEILLNTVLEKEVKLNQRMHLSEENPPTLPLKFSFPDEDEKPPEKSESEIEIENLFADLEMGRLQTESGSSPQSMMDNGNVDDTNGCTNPGGHYRIIDEEIGVVCKYCPAVFTEMRHLFPKFVIKSSQRHDRRFFGESEQPDVADMLGDAPTNNCAQLHSVEAVWDLVPQDIKEKMYQHQRDGYEFMWRNIGGGLDIKNMKELPSSEGKGCIISHAPGTGKTGLSVVFLQSFMKLFPMCRPVVIAPRSMLLTWENEFQKWDVDIPFHNLNNPKLSGKENVAADVQGCNRRMFSQKFKGRDLNRTLKLYSWANGCGILGITYRLFEKLAGGSAEDDKMRRILLKYPGLLVLDEGHTPRNDESLMWRALSKVETPLRIILSGTPFQNNFQELYNTLCLVSPDFSVSTPSSSRKYVQKGGKAAKNKWTSITSSLLNNENDIRIEELKQMISPFVHVHKGHILLEKLPGLRDALVYLKLTGLQQELLDTISKKNFIEQDNLMTLISVHPSLAAVYFSRSDVKDKDLELDPSAGVKTKFVFELIKLCRARGERIIVFSRLIEPLSLIKQQLLHHLKWSENKEILYMDGKIDAKYRQDRICAFNNPESEAQVLLASTASCCEGINLIGASRIVLLDVVWNPSITRQAISRAYRLGQTKVVYVYNLISSTFEARKYECQARKDRMSELVFSDREENHCSRTDNLSNTLSEDMILDAMVENPSLRAMFERVVHHPRNQHILWSDPTTTEGLKLADQS